MLQHDCSRNLDFCCVVLLFVSYNRSHLIWEVGRPAGVCLFFASSGFNCFFCSVFLICSGVLCLHLLHAIDIISQSLSEFVVHSTPGLMVKMLTSSSPLRFNQYITEGASWRSKVLKQSKPTETRFLTCLWLEGDDCSMGRL